LHDFEERYCYDRYWNGVGQERPGTRFMCTGRVFTLVGDCGERVFVDRKTDLEQFRHEYFLLFLIPHFHKAALLMLADCLVDAMNNLDITKRDSVRQFRAVIRHTLGVFLRFSHRYWSHQVSDHGQVKELYRMISDHLGTDRLYAELRSELEDMSQYLDSEALRRQGETMVRLTVVATMGLIGVASTGFWGMNLFVVTDEPPLTRFFYFLTIMILAIGLTFYTMLKSRRLSDFLETLADEHQSSRAKLAALANVWKRKRDRERPH
jgi:Mg2+ and Co2+ transporter CorA